MRLHFGDGLDCDVLIDVLLELVRGKAEGIEDEEISQPQVKTETTTSQEPQPHTCGAGGYFILPIEFQE